ncbi:pyridoxine 5'-phosphate oxidase C-terminal domain-containing protein, partial [Streptomyces olivaceoviridis]
RYPEDEQVPVPPHWGGFRVTPETIEFWQGRETEGVTVALARVGVTATPDGAAARVAAVGAPAVVRLRVRGGRSRSSPRVPVPGK